MSKETVKVEFRQVKKELIKDLIQTDIVDLSCRKDFDQELRKRREENYVLEYQVAK